MKDCKFSVETGVPTLVKVTSQDGTQYELRLVSSVFRVTEDGVDPLGNPIFSVQATNNMHIQKVEETSK